MNGEETVGLQAVDQPNDGHAPLAEPHRKLADRRVRAARVGMRCDQGEHLQPPGVANPRRQPDGLLEERPAHRPRALLRLVHRRPRERGGVNSRRRATSCAGGSGRAGPSSGPARDARTRDRAPARGPCEARARRRGSFETCAGSRRTAPIVPARRRRAMILRASRAFRLPSFAANRVTIAYEASRRHRLALARTSASRFRRPTAAARTSASRDSSVVRTAPRRSVSSS